MDDRDRDGTAPGGGRGWWSRIDAGCVVVGLVLLAMVVVPVWLLARWLGVDLLLSCGVPDVELHPRATVVGHTVHVDGDANLPDGAVLWTRAWHQRFDPRTDDGWSTHDGSTTVNDGRFAYAIDLSDYPEGTAILTTEFSVGWYDMPAQPAAVIARYGPDGGCVRGPQTTQEIGLVPRARVTVTAELRPAPDG